MLLIAGEQSDELLREAIHNGARGFVGYDTDGPGLARAVLACARGEVRAD